MTDTLLPPTTDALVRLLERHAQAGQIMGIVTRGPRSVSTAPWPKWVPETVLAAIRAAGAPRAWSHQLEAAEAIHAHHHTVLATETASGKSLAAWVPLLSDIVHSRGNSTHLAHLAYRPTALYLSPTKALAADQAAALHHLIRPLTTRIGVAVADGDTDAAERAWARDMADIVLTNPDFAHFGILPRHHQWARLFRGLDMIIVDEFHSYRGMFGAHVAHIVRRLLRTAQFYGASPTVVFLSATTGAPRLSTKQFLGSAFGPIVEITKDGSPRGKQVIMLWRARPSAQSDALDDSDALNDTDDGDPLLQQDEDGPRRAANTEAGELTGLLVGAGARTLTFVRSRPGTESVAAVARSWLHDHAPTLETRVAAYRGGYLPEERRELEQQLKKGELRALASTNALELGIDISGLDAVVVTGWPGTHASFSQQIGRAGRSGRASLAVFVGRENPLDQYLLENPAMVTDAPTEVNVFDPNNPHALIPELCAAAAEVPLTDKDAEVFGLPDTHMFDDLAEQGLLRKRPTGWYWNTALGFSAHDTVDLRGTDATVTIVEQPSGILLGTVDAARADSSVFPGAIYVHQGVAFRVDQLHDGVALVHRYEGEEIRTYAREETSVEIRETAQSVDIASGTWAWGDITVYSRVIGYDVRRFGDGMYLGMVPLDMPLRQLDTSAVWWTMKQTALRSAGVEPPDLPGALHAAEHASIGMLPLFALCDRWDLGGLSTALHPQTGEPTVFVHDALAGGSGCAHRGFVSGLQWVNSTLHAIESCPCRSGCPRCIQSPKCGNNNEPLSKAGAMRVLRLLRDAMGTMEDRPPGQPRPRGLSH